jgi:hypothetical protein
MEDEERPAVTLSFSFPATLTPGTWVFLWSHVCDSHLDAATVHHNSVFYGVWGSRSLAAYYCPVQQG